MQWPRSQQAGDGGRALQGGRHAAGTAEQGAMPDSAGAVKEEQDGEGSGPVQMELDTAPGLGGQELPPMLLQEMGLTSGVLGDGVDGNLPLYEQVEHWLLSHSAERQHGDNGGGGKAPGPGATSSQLLDWRQQFLDRLHDLVRLEQGASVATSRHMDARTHLPSSVAGAAPDGVPDLHHLVSACHGGLPWGLGLLVGRAKTYVLQHAAVSVGRSTRTRGQVDVDLGEEPQAHKMSRHAARICLESDGQFHVHNTGQKVIHVNATEVPPSKSAPLPHLSLLSISGTHLLFMANLNALRRLNSRMGKLAALSH